MVAVGNAAKEPMVKMSQLSESLTLYRSLGHDGFLRHHAHPMLLHVQRQDEPLAPEAMVNFPNLLAQAKASDVLVIPVLKRVAGPATGSITVGRTDESDIHLPFADISKEHAVFGHKAGTYTVTDLGSRNGTYLGGRALNKNVPELLEDGADVAFARIHCCFMLPEGFAMLLKWVKIPTQ